MRRMRALAAGPVVGLALLVLLPDARAQDGEESVTATGSGIIKNGDVARARDDAVADAMRKAVEQVVGAYVESETRIENYQLMEDRIYSRTQGYVKNYKVLKDGPPQTTVNLYEVTIEAEVTASLLKDDLGAIGLLVARQGNPRTMVFIVEQSIGQERYVVHWHNLFSGETQLLAAQTAMGVAENTLLDVLGRKGFPLSDRPVREGKIRLSPGFQIDKLTDAQVTEMGDLTGAEIVIYGKALANEQGRLRDSPMMSANATISARAVRTATGQVLASGTATGAAVHVDPATAGSEAIRKATEELAQKLVTDIAAVWSRESTGAATINLRVLKSGGQAALAKFQQALARLSGVQAVHPRRAEGDNGAEIDVEYRGLSQRLADDLVAAKLPGVRVKVLATMGNRIDLEVVER